jgi:beta-glucanase (GH16 family)
MKRTLNRWQMKLWLPTVAILALILSPAALLAGKNGKKGGHGTSGSGSGWSDDFSGSRLNSHMWVVASGQAPGYIACTHLGLYDPSNVSLQNGYLVLKLTQTAGKVDGCDGVISDGALVYTRKTYGYGTYTWTMRMSSTATTFDGTGYPTSGSVSAGFLYVNNSQTEIDFEFPGYSVDSEYPSDTLYLVNWLNTNPSSDPTGSEETFTVETGLNVATTFHTYSFVWQPGEIDYYIDDNPVPVATHTTNVPSAPAHFMINHWGTDSDNWGGVATLDNTPRYFYIDSVSYTPLQ